MFSHTHVKRFLIGLMLALGWGNVAFAQDNNPYPIEFSVGAGYSESLGVFALANVDNLFQGGGLGGQARAGQYGFEASFRAKLDLVYGVSAVFNLGAAYTWTGFFGLLGRVGLEYRPEFYRQLAIFAEYGPVSYFTDKSYFAWNFGACWYL